MTETFYMNRAAATITARAKILDPMVFLALPVKGVTLPGEYVPVPLALEADREPPLGSPAVAVPLFAGNGAEVATVFGCTEVKPLGPLEETAG